MKSRLRTIFLFLMLLSPIVVHAATIEQDSVGKNPIEEIISERVVKRLKRFNEIDSLYIEPQKYNFTFMLQNTNTYESYTISNENGTSVKFSPDISFRLGPYFGWRWIFLGYTIDFSHLGSDKKNQTFDISIYSNKVGVDFYYRKTGNDYKIRRMKFNDEEIDDIEDIDFSGIHSSVKGFDLYYIFNHRKFSYPAAYSQSTIQRRSCGSPLVGIGYTRHKLEIDLTQLQEVVGREVGEEYAESFADSTFIAERISYSDISFSGGYAYNWVFARNWLFNATLSLAFGYKRTHGEREKERFSLRDFSIHNFNLEGVTRFGIVWNNSKYFAGASAIFHTYNYKKNRFATNNTFGYINIYAGFNFNKRK